MEPLNVVEYISSRFILSAITPMVRSLTLEHSEEPRSGSVIAIEADHTHAAHQTVIDETSLVVATGQLTASIRA
jgi:hypothetical protein